MNRDEKIEILTHSMCGKPSAMPPLECRATIGATNPLCNEFEKPAELRGTQTNNSTISCHQ